MKLQRCTWTSRAPAFNSQWHFSQNWLPLDIHLFFSGLKNQWTWVSYPMYYSDKHYFVRPGYQSLHYHSPYQLWSWSSVGEVRVKVWRRRRKVLFLSCSNLSRTRNLSLNLKKFGIKNCINLQCLKISNKDRMCSKSEAFFCNWRTGTVKGSVNNCFFSSFVDL